MMGRLFSYNPRGSFAGTAEKPLLADSSEKDAAKQLARNPSVKLVAAGDPRKNSFTVGKLVGGAQDLIISKQGELKKKSSSILKGWTKKTVRLYRTGLMFSDTAQWSPSQNDMIALPNIVSSSLKKDGEFEIVERNSGKNVIVKFKADSDSDAEEWVLAITEAKVNLGISDRSEKHGENPEICNKLSAAEVQRLFREFTRHDKDGSGSICTDEFREMCKELGVNLTQEQAAAAVKELDRNGDGTCDFEEMLWFWAKTPEMGGHSAIGLQFLQAKLKAKHEMEKSFEALGQRMVALDQQVDESDGTSLKFTYALNPIPATPSEAKISAMVNLSKESSDFTKAGGSRVVVMLQAEPGEASRVRAELNSLISKYEEKLNSLFGAISLSPDEDGVIAMTIDISADTAVAMTSQAAAMAPTMEASPVWLLLSWLKRLDASLSLNIDFNDMLGAPDKSLDLGTVLRHSCSVDMLVCPQMKNLLLGMLPWSSAVPAAAWKLLGGFQGDLQLAYDPGQVEAVLAGFLSHDLLEMTKPSTGQLLMKQNFDGVSDEMKSDLKGFYSCLEDLSAIHSVTIDGSFGAPPATEASAAEPWKQLTVELQNCNPFPLMRYIMGPVVEDAGAGNTSAQRPLSLSERKKLKTAFEKYDKDNSGALDLNELHDMVIELGGKLSPEEAAEAMQQLDKDGSGTIDFDEFLAWWTSTSGLGGYSSIALETMKLQIAAQEGFGGLKKKFLTLFPGKDQEGLTLNASIEMAPGMAAIESAKAAVKSLIRKALPGGWLSSSTPCVEISLAVGRSNAKAAAASLQEALDVLSEVLNMFIPNGGWKSSVGNDVNGAASIVIVGNLAELMKTATSDEQFMQIVNRVVEGIEQLELGCVAATELEEFLASPDQPLVHLVRGLKVSVKSQVTTDGKALLQEACLISLLKMLVGIDLQVLLGYHEKYLKDEILELETRADNGKGREGVRWFSLDDAREYVQTNYGPDGNADEFKSALTILRKVTDALTGINSITFRQIPVGTEAKDVVIECNRFNVFPLLSYVLESLFSAEGALTLDLAEGETAPVVPKKSTTLKKKKTGGDSPESKGKVSKVSKAGDSPDAANGKVKGKAKAKSPTKKAPASA